MKLLLVDNDHDLVEMLAGWLKTLGYEVSHAYTGERAKIEWAKHQPDLVILDTALKDVDALAMCREMRSRYDALLLVIADGNVQDEIHALESGADDYLRKPFSPAQFLAHVHAVSRRRSFMHIQQPSATISIGPIRVDSLHNQVSICDKTIRLTPTESKLLHLLAVNANQVCTASHIVAHVWGFNDAAGDSALIKAHIRHLRQKIEPDAGNPRYIQTVPGSGYMLVPTIVEEQDSRDVAQPLSAVSV